VARKDQMGSLPALRDALFSMPTNQLSEVIETPIGYYLVRVKERRPEGKAEFDDVKDGIRDLLLTQEVEKRLPDWFSQLEKEYEVEVSLGL
jgi:parvulin-like peptidyl-prolyl isomerase